MKVSVLVPVYNVEKWLPACLDSILNSTWKDLEVILINDGSTDDSLAIAENYARKDDRIHIYSYENSGISRTRNRSLAHATGDAFLFVDSDDHIDVQMIETLVRTMEQKHCDIVQCGYVMDFGPVPFYRPGSRRKVYTQEEALHALVANKGLNNYPWGKLYRRHTFEGVRFPENVRGFEDTRTIFRTFIHASRIATIPDRFYHYVQRRGSLTNCMDLETVYDMRHAYEYQQACLEKAFPHETFDFTEDFYNTDMVIIYTLIVFSRKKQNPEFVPADLDWSRISPILKGAYGAWLKIACLKFHWDIRKIPWK